MKIFNAEIENFYASKIPARRPNSMNNYGDLVAILVRKSGIDYRYDFFQSTLTIDTCFYISWLYTFFGWLLGWKELENWNWHPRRDCERDWHAAHDHPVPARVYLANCI